MTVLFTDLELGILRRCAQERDVPEELVIGLLSAPPTNARDGRSRLAVVEALVGEVALSLVEDGAGG